MAGIPSATPTTAMFLDRILPAFAVKVPVTFFDPTASAITVTDTFFDTTACAITVAATVDHGTAKAVLDLKVADPAKVGLLAAGQIQGNLKAKGGM